MSKKQSPCLTCTRVKNPGDCENKNCREWSAWFLKNWKQIHNFYEKYKSEEGAKYELEK